MNNNKERKNAVFASMANNGDKSSAVARQPRRRTEQHRRMPPGRRVGGVRHLEKQQDAKDILKKIPPVGNNLRIIPLGGVEEVGRNMTVIEYRDDIIIMDCGLQFKDTDTPGIDYIIPNVRYLIENKHKIRGIFITHGHLDHIGAVPYVIDQIGNPPIYSREFGAVMIQKRQLEFPHLPPLDIKVLGDGEKILVGKNFKVETFAISHTIPDTVGYIIETEIGKIVFVEDVRVDNADGVPSEEEVRQYERFKDEKILFLTLDSTSVEKPGFSISEDLVVKNIDKIIGDAKGRIIIGTFASQVERIISIIGLAGKYGRKVVIEGRSMKSNLEIIKQLNLLRDTGSLIPMEDIDNYPPQKIMMIATGAQGEEFAALMRIANKTHKKVALNKTDTVLLSSSIIPGNEYSTTKLKDNLYRSEAKIITYRDSDVHASGHGNKGELQWIHKQIDYKFFMPVHGHHFMLRQHAEMSHSLGTPTENIIVPDNGSIVEIDDKGEKIRMLKEKAPSGMMTVDGFSIGDVQEVVIRDRKMLAEEGMFVIIASINTRTGKLKKSPDIISRGFVYLRESQELLQHARLIIKKTVEESTAGMNPINFDFVKANITENVSRFLFQKTAKHPVVIPVVLEV